MAPSFLTNSDFNVFGVKGLFSDRAFKYQNCFSKCSMCYTRHLKYHATNTKIGS
jgi:hypothetical protein